MRGEASNLHNQNQYITNDHQIPSKIKFKNYDYIVDKHLF